jgi:hypothetical protein
MDYLTLFSCVGGKTASTPLEISLGYALADCMDFILFFIALIRGFELKVVKNSLLIIVNICR